MCFSLAVVSRVDWQEDSVTVWLGGSLPVVDGEIMFWIKVEATQKSK